MGANEDSVPLVYVGFYFSLCWVLFYFVFMGGGEGMHGMCVTVLYL